MRIVFLLCLMVIHATTAFRISTGGCTFTALNTNKIKGWPVFAENSQFIYADPRKTVINKKVGDTIEVICSGRKVLDTNLESVNATCKAGNKFAIGDTKVIDFNKSICTEAPLRDARKTKKPCEQKGEEAVIGFTKVGGYIQQIRLCFDPITQLALYADYTVSKSIGYSDSSARPEDFQIGPFYKLGGKKINILYQRNTQRITINRLLGLKDDDKTIIQDKTDIFLSRGHLAARREFVYGNQQINTFHYINVAPQWQSFNGRNWERVESNLAMFIEKHSIETYPIDMKVYTGTWGVTTLPHSKTKVPVPLYLYVNGNQRALPVPDLFWKAVYHTVTKKAVVIFGVNNPHKKLADIQAHSVICKDVLPKIKWLTFDNAHNITEGYMYACEFADAKAKIKYLPDWKVTGLFI